MKYVAPLLALMLLCAGCDSRDFSGPDDPVDPPGEPNPAAATFKVAYLVEGTYFSCQISYTDPAGKTVAVPQAVSLPWSRVFEVTVSVASGPFDARVSATCADPTKLGKSTATLLVDDAVKATESAVGYGATARAEHLIGVK